MMYRQCCLIHSFVSSVVENDIVNMVTAAAGAAGEPRTVQRARVCEVRPDDFLLEIYGEQGLRAMSKSDVEARVRHAALVALGNTGAICTLDDAIFPALANEKVDLRMV